MSHRLATSLLMLVLVLSACKQGGSIAAANTAADNFMTMLAHRDAEEAWFHLDPESRQRLYDDDMSAFARDVNEADWSRLTWEFGPVVDFDYNWEVHGTAQRSLLPGFLVERGIVAWSDPWFVMQVQFPRPLSNDYLIMAWQD